MKYICPCCGYRTLQDSPGLYDICPVCFWEDDPIQSRDETHEGGANGISLKQARENFKKYGACEQNAIESVRSPYKDEMT